jgi:hypothetical protein
MADRYWVGGSGTWDATTTTNWATSSGGAGGASAPTSADNVIFNTLSNAILYTVTVGTNATCADFTVAAPLTGAVTFSLSATAVISCYGSMTLPASNCTWTSVAGATLNFLATTTGKTVTTNGISLTQTGVYFNDIGGGWTLGSAFTSTSTIFLTAGNFNTGNYNVTCNIVNSSGTNTRSVTLGSSTISVTGANGMVFVSTSLTLSAGTSQITMSNASPTFAGGGLTFYNLTFSSTALSAASITGSNTFNNVTFTARAAAGIGSVALDAGGTNTVNGTLTLGSGTTGVARLFVRSATVGGTTTLSVATLAAMTDIDFRDITAAGASSPWSGTRIGNCLGNTNITFTGARTVYWNSAASATWNAAVWSTTSGNTGGTTTALPLAQDTIIIDDAGLTAGNSITLSNAFNVGTLDFSTRTNALTFNNSGSPAIYGDYTFSSAVTIAQAGTVQFVKQSGTATIKSAAIEFTQNITFNAPSGTIRIDGNLTINSVRTTNLTAGTLDLTNNGAGNYVLSTGLVNSNNSNTRAITFGTGNITVIANNAIIWNMATATGFSYTGTPTVNCTYSGSIGTRQINFGTTSGGTENNSLNYNISAGTDIILFGTNNTSRNINFTGFSGSVTNLKTIYGNLTISTGMSISSGSATTFAATSGIQQITTNNKTLDCPLTQNGVGGTLQLQDNLTIGSTQTFTLTAGTLDLSSGNRTLSAGNFSSVNSNTRSILFGTGNITLTNNNLVLFSMSTSTGFTYTGTPNVNLTYSGSTGTRTISYGTTGGTESNALNFNVSAGTDSIVFSAKPKNINFTGFSGTLSPSIITMYGDLTISTGMSLASTSSVLTFGATSGTQQITTNGKTLDFPITQDGVGGTVQPQDNLTIGSTATYTLTNGTLSFNGKTISTGLFSTSNSNARTIAFGTGVLTLTGAGTAFDATTATNLTVTGQTTATIDCTSSSTKTFVGGGLYYPKINQGGLGNLQISGANTFYNMTNTVQPSTITFPASTITNFYNFNVNGIAGNLVSLVSSTPGTRYTLNKL